MNEFEIKAAKQTLKTIGLKDIYNVSEEYNEKEYGNIEVDAVIEYEYKGANYLTHVIFGTMVGGRRVEKEENKIQKVKDAVIRSTMVAEEQLYSSESQNASGWSLESFISTQVDLMYAKEEKTHPHKEFYEIDQVWERIREGKKGQENNLQVYKDCMEIAKEWV